MPYKLRKEGNEWCVYKDDGTNKGCSKTRAKGVAYLRKLYSIESGDKMGKKELDELTIAAVEDFNKEYPEEMFYWSAATSFAELDQERAAREASREISKTISQTAYDFQMLSENVRANPEIEDKLSAISALAEEMAQRLAGEAEDDISEAEDEEKQVTGWFDKVKENVLSLFKKDRKLAPEPNSDFMVWKEANGSSRWLVRYTNSFRDRDKPAQIISSSSHKRFVERVEKGLVDYPEFWLWHVKEWKIGKADWLAVDDKGDGVCFAIASGTFDTETPKEIIDWLEEHQKELGVSHGMPYTSLKYDETDDTIIVEHDTKEISPLPRDKAANVLTDFIMEKEADTMIPKNKKQELIDKGVSADALDALEKMNAKTAAKAIDSGIDFKEKNDDNAVNDVPVQEPEPIKEVENPLESPVTRQEVVDVIASVIKPRLDALDAQFATIEASLKELTGRVSAKETLIDNITPTASLQAQLIQRLTSPGAVVKQDDPLLNQKPKETPAIEPNASPTGIPMIDGFLTGKR